MKKQEVAKDTKELPQMSQEDFLERFYDGKISYKLPSKYPENFSLCPSYNDGKKEIPLTHKDKVGAILKDCYTAVKPIVKKFKLSLALLVESNVTYKGVAWTKRIRIDFSMPSLGGKREELIAYTSMIQIKIRNKECPQNPKKFLNKTTILAIMLHELAHTRHMHHKIEFALFLKEMFEHAMTLGIFPENEEHMLPSSRAWERRMFETKGRMTREELETFFEGETDNADHSDGEHGEGWGHGEHGQAQEKSPKMMEEEKKELPRKDVEKEKKKVVSTVQNKNENKTIQKQPSKVIPAATKSTALKVSSAPKGPAMDIENVDKKTGGIEKNKTLVKSRTIPSKTTRTEIKKETGVSKKSLDIEAEKEIKEILNTEEKKEDNDVHTSNMESETIQA